jgi:hypothetical protein
MDAGGRATHGAVAENTKKKYKLRVLRVFVVFLYDFVISVKNGPSTA